MTVQQSAPETNPVAALSAQDGTGASFGWATWVLTAATIPGRSGQRSSSRPISASVFGIWPSPAPRRLRDADSIVDRATDQGAPTPSAAVLSA